MKMYQVKNIITVIACIVACVSFYLSMMCNFVYCDNNYALGYMLFFIISCLIGICSGIGAIEDKLDYQIQQQYVKVNYFDRLVYLYKKYGWIIDVGLIVPQYTNKTRIRAYSFRQVQRTYPARLHPRQCHSLGL